MTSGSKFIRTSVYDLPSIAVGETRVYEGLDEKQRKALQRSANNYGIRTELYFSTRIRDGVVYVTRIR